LNIRVAHSPAEALHGAGIVATATTSNSPVFADTEVEPGAHINGVGSFTHEMREVPGETVARALLVVDAREGCLAEAGDVLIPLLEGLFEASHIQAELGEVVAGKHPGRSTPNQITFFKSVGNAVQDVALANYLYQKAQSLGLGVRVEL
jgi:ornithine cyclodeaminase/alanine dehydrogenase-like protein (mu-crystallin family)